MTIFHRRNWKRWLLAVCAAMGVAFSASAQRQGQQIIFSQPDTDAMTNSAPPLTPTALAFPDFVKNVSSPIPTPPSLQPPPAPVQAITPAQTAASQLELDRQRNWTLLTPAEILGVPTMENTLGLSERNAAGEIKNQTALERYFERQQQAQNTAMTNAAINANALSDWKVQRREQPEWNSGFSATRNDSPFGAISDNRNANQNISGGWLQTAGAPATTPAVQTPEQLEEARTEAANFQKLLQPGLAASSAKTKPAVSWPEPTPNSSVSPASSSSIGNSFAPISSDVKTPQGVMPLPGPTGNKNSSTTPVVPEWKRKLPPWWSTQPSDKNF